MVRHERRQGFLLRLLLACMALACGVGQSMASAQGAGSTADGTYVTTTGATITWEEPWAALEDGLALDETADVIFIANDDALVVIGTGWQPAGSATSSMLFVGVGADPESITNVDTGESGDVSYWLDLGMRDTVPYGAFTLARDEGVAGTTMTMVIAPVAEFADDLASAQAGVAIDGDPVLSGVAGDGLQELLESSLGEPAGATPAAVADEDGSAGNDADGSSKLGGGSAAAGSWTDPIHGFEVTWEGEWDQSVRGENTLMLVSEDGSVFLSLTGQATGGGSVADYERFMMDLLADLEVDIDPAATYRDDDNLILAGTLESTPFIQEIIFVDGGELAITITLGIDPAADIDEALAMYRESVVIAGVAPLDGWETIDFPA